MTTPTTSELLLKAERHFDQKVDIGAIDPDLESPCISLRTVFTLEKNYVVYLSFIHEVIQNSELCWVPTENS